jgi:hypothetical protein
MTLYSHGGNVLDNPDVVHYVTYVNVTDIPQVGLFCPQLWLAYFVAGK